MNHLAPRLHYETAKFNKLVSSPYLSLSSLFLFLSLSLSAASVTFEVSLETRFVTFDREKFLLCHVKLDLCIQLQLFIKRIRLCYYYSAAQRNIFIPIVLFLIFHLNNMIDNIYPTCR